MDQDLLQRVLECPRLPSLPAIALEVIELCRQDDVAIDHIAATISKDPALSGKILRTVNSSFYGLREPVATISHALVILGLNSVRTLALGFTLVSSFKDTGGEQFDPNIIWRQSLYSAIAARTIAQHVGVEAHEEAFLAGLLQDIGVLAMVQTVGPEYVELLRDFEQDHRNLWRAERDRFDLDHPRVGEALATRWKLPAILTAPIRHHEKPGDAPPVLQRMIHVVALGGLAADVYLSEDSRTSLKRFLLTARKWFGIEPTPGRKLLSGIRKGTDELAKLFEIQTGQVNDPSAILTDANDLLQEFSLQSEQTASLLEAENRQLQQKVTRDPLTNIGNRGHFNACLGRFFERSSRQGEPLSLILIDADNFKPLNDTYGHLAGDRVLITLARLLHEATPEAAEVCRYGGEEFGILLPGTPRAIAVRIAEHVRRKIESTPMEVDEGQTLSITASLGVATYDGVRFFRRPEQLIKVADQAVYAAKGNGRNCVRVFTPRAAQTQTSA